MKTTKIKWRPSSGLKSVLVIYGLLLAIFLVMMVVAPDYRSINNLGNIIVQCVPLAIVSLGQTIVMIGGGIDMSVGMTISLTSCLAATTMTTGTPGYIVGGLLAIIASALAVGLLNGLGTHYCNVPALITTLSMMMILNGVSLYILPGAGGTVDKGFADILMSRFGLVSVSLIILVAVFALLRHFLYNTSRGVFIYAIGKSKPIAASMGVPVKRTGVLTFVLSALMAALAGLLLASRMRVGDPLTGSSFGLDSITAAAIGGTSLSGGVGLLSGTIAGAFLIGMLSNMMNILGINHFYQYVLKGLLLVVAMIFYSLSHRGKEVQP